MRHYAERHAMTFTVLLGEQQDVVLRKILQEMTEYEWDRALFVHPAVYCRKHAPNIFTEYKFSAARGEFPHPRPHDIQKSVDWLRSGYAPLWPRLRYYNTDVLVLDYTSLMKLRRVLDKETTPADGEFACERLNWLLHQAGAPDEMLTKHWNASVNSEWCTIIKSYTGMNFLNGNSAGKPTNLERLQEFITKYP